jgi:hypothetical protein
MVKNYKLKLKALLSLYVLLCASLFSYLYLIRFETIAFGQYIFWGLVSLIYIILIIQIFITNFSKKLEALMLLQLVIFSLLLNSIFQLPFSLIYGSDSSMESYVVKTLIDNGHIRLNLTNYSFWPIVHIYGAIVYNLTNWDLNYVMKYVPSFIALSVIPLIYVFFKQVLEKEDQKYKLAFLATIFFIFLYNRILFGSIFVRQTIAIPILLLIIYFYYKRPNLSDHNKILISILIITLVFEIAMSHHFTSFLLIIFFIILFTYEYIGKKYFAKKDFNKNNQFFLICGVIILFYWAYIAILPLMSVGTFVNELITPSAADPTFGQSMHVNTIRDYMILFGFLLFNGFFGLIMLFQFKKIKEYQVFILFLVFCGIAGVVNFFFIQSIFPDRFLLFGWLFGSVALIVAISKLESSKLKKISIGLFILFFFYNIYEIEPNVYTHPADIINQPNIEGYDLINNINMSNATYLSTAGDRSIVWSIYGNSRATSATDLDLLSKNLNKNYTYFKFVIWNKKVDQIPLDIETNEKMKIYRNYVSEIDQSTDTNYLKIADTNGISIYRRKT